MKLVNIIWVSKEKDIYIMISLLKFFRKTPKHNFPEKEGIKAKSGREKNRGERGQTEIRWLRIEKEGVRISDFCADVINK